MGAPPSPMPPQGNVSECLHLNSTATQLTPPSQDWFTCPISPCDRALEQTQQKTVLPKVLLLLRESAAAVT
jgi:hypothetical protein